MIAILTGRFVVLLAMDLSVLLPGLYLAGALLVGAGIIAGLKRWQRNEEPRGGDASDQLARYRTLYEQGVINEEEFKRLRGVLGGELRRSVESASRPATSPLTSQSPEPPAANGQEVPPQS
jgi:hypothetical protein